MRNPHNAFHLAIPCRNLDEALDFYVNRLGCGSARRYENRLTIDFFGDQLVCHLSPDKIDRTPELYPRHFGMTFREPGDFDRVLVRARERRLEFYKDVFERFSGRPEVHRTFILKDPSNNLVEFKCYENQDRMY